MKIKIGSSDIAVFASKNYLQVRVDRAGFAFGPVELEVAKRRFSMKLVGRGFAGPSPALRLAPRDGDLREVIAAIGQSDVAWIRGLKPLQPQ